MSKPVLVQLVEARPNGVFTEEHRQMVRFLRYTASVPCAACGTRSKHHWTMLVSFAIVEMETFIARPSAVVHLPLMPVCRSHPLAVADWQVPTKRTKKEYTP